MHFPGVILTVLFLNWESVFFLVYIPHNFQGMIAHCFYVICLFRMELGTVRRKIWNLVGKIWEGMGLLFSIVSTQFNRRFGISVCF